MTIVRADRIVVDFPLYGTQSRSVKKALMRAATGGRIAQDSNDRVVIRALDELSFTLDEGDRLGIIGHNGSGKSTLLRVLAGIYEPVSGELLIKGRVVPLLSVLVGMDVEATGYENIRRLGILLGLSIKEIDAKIEEIADFTELGDYLSMPLRTYSSGMLLRVAFSVATTIDPDIVLMDEWLGVGDAHFIEKANARLDELITRAGILVLASHSPVLLRRTCNKGIVLRHGKIVHFGNIDEALDLYASEG